MSKDLKQRIIDSIRKSFRYEIKDTDLFISAITHKSTSQSNNYERLEILGDAVIQLSITELLFEKYPKYSEGYITVMRQNLVNSKNLERIMNKLNLVHIINLRNNLKDCNISCDVFESIIGAIFLDSNYNKSKRIIHSIFTPLLSDELLSKDNKTQLQEFLHSKKLSLPVYRTEKSTNKNYMYKISCSIPKTKINKSIYSNKVKPAQQELAQLVLSVLDESN